MFFVYGKQKPAGFILHPEGFMRECLNMDVSLRTMDGVMWKGVLKEVSTEGNVIIRPAQEMLFGEKDGPELPEKQLYKHNIIWLRRHPKDTDILIGVPGRGPPAPERRYEPGTEPQPDEEAGETDKGAAASADEP
ncbi:hypothetical protein BBJ28_00018984 [Nothophytophthora sp. Chile5]|nr:hypothetical protein BBJ28_00018984 [Nothophytophthora sp. Chile5]